MARDGAGNFTLVSGNPVVDGTIIETTWVNPTMADFAVQFNNVLTRDGVLGPNLAFKLIDGTAAAPSLTFSTQTNQGLYKAASNQLGVAIAGVSAGFFSAGGWNGIVGGTTPAAGTFTALTSTGNTALGDAAADT